MKKSDLSTNLIKMSEVNLDALIPREDLEVKLLKSINNNVPSININSLKKGEFFFENLRKPDFQRETCEWTPERICNLVISFVSGDLIPSIILWKGEGYTFVIDGAHRLSALVAWVMNDYGDKSLSKAFFGEIEDSQILLAQQTRNLIEKNVGSFEDIIWANQHQDKADPNRVEIAQRLGSLPIYLQWVPGDATNAEKSFFKINESASPIDKTEKRLLKSRNKPSAIAARAISRAGTGHKYWSKFPILTQEKIETLSKEINGWLFTPKLKTPVKTLDIPLAGKSHSEIRQELILNITNFSNALTIVDKSNVKKDEDYPEYKIADESKEGKDTIEYLINTKKMLANITGSQSSSLGLHPVIYFYSKQGRYQVTSFMAVIHLIREYEQKKKLKKFTKVRALFEEFLWKHKNIVNQSQTEWGSGAKGYLEVSSLFDFIITEFQNSNTEGAILTLLNNHPKFGFYKPLVKDHDPKKNQDFSSETKSEVFLREAIEKALRCKICNGFIHLNSIQIDHDKAKEDGGLGVPENGQLTHPYCNSIKKDLVTEGFLKLTKD